MAWSHPGQPRPQAASLTNRVRVKGFRGSSLGWNVNMWARSSCSRRATVTSRGQGSQSDPEGSALTSARSGADSWSTIRSAVGVHLRSRPMRQAVFAPVVPRHHARGSCLRCRASLRAWLRMVRSGHNRSASSTFPASTKKPCRFTKRAPVGGEGPHAACSSARSEWITPSRNP